MIRPAIHEDIPRILQMAHGFHSDAIEGLNLGYNPSDYSRYILFLLDNPITTVLVLEDGGKVIGTIAGIISPWFMDNRDRIVTEQWVWVEPEARGRGSFKKLIEALVEWGKGFGATKLSMIAIGSGTEDQVRDFYKKQGFKYMETHFIKEI